ncbi:glutaredoxin-like protein, putative [Babesia caballi]|uniref:Glutaredoxin-1 n=1 Tax=Babesia caballi TaxID=5871 RepID=A0AAV4M1Q8_BABCB|nr:glutaredoxin-like protein, putative [Babesia caballi]
MEKAQVASWVDAQARQSKVVIFTSSTCPYCVKASGILMGAAPSDVTLVDLDDHPDREDIMEYFRETTGMLCRSLFIIGGTFRGARTVPRVFIGGKFFGDCSKTVAAQESGELNKILIDAGCKVE